MIQAVIFDMDGVLFDTEQVMKEGWLKAGKELNFQLTEKHLGQMRGGSSEQNAALFQKWFEGKIDYHRARSIRSQYLSDYIEKHSVPEKKGLQEIVTYLTQEQIPWSVATSTPRKRASHYWELADIAKFMTASVCGDEVQHSKPNPEIFLEAAQKLRIPPQNCLIVEDSINGLKAGKAANGVTCMVPDLTPYTAALEPFCDYVCKDLTQVIALISSQKFIKF